MKRSALLLVLIVSFLSGNAQITGSDSSAKTITDSSKQSFIDTIHKKKIKAKMQQVKALKPKIQINVDSTLVLPRSVAVDTLLKDSFLIAKQDSISTPIKHLARKSDNSNYSAFVLSNSFMNTMGHPVLMINKIRVQTSKENVFYIIVGLLLLFGLFKVFYSKYFFNLFKVFFNTSLRQNQLTDILLQARLASLMFNILFAFSAGTYLWLVLKYKGVIRSENLLYLPICILAVTCVYLIKYLIIKFIGWLTSYKQASNQYIFVIFLINKIIGVFLLPFIILFAFGPSDWISSLLLSSFLLLGTLFLLRYFRTYGILQKQLSLNLFHFSLYLTGVEILPLIALFRLLSRLPQLVF